MLLVEIIWTRKVFLYERGTGCVNDRTKAFEWVWRGGEDSFEYSTHVAFAVCWIQSCPPHTAAKRAPNAQCRKGLSLLYAYSFFLIVVVYLTAS